MFKCNNCGLEFEEPKAYRESHGLEHGWEELYCCPNCGEADYDEATECQICGEPVFGERFCKDCMDRATEFIKLDYKSIKTDHPAVRLTDLTDLFSEALDAVYVEERSKK